MVPIFALLPILTHSWWGHAHMIIASIAETKLSAREVCAIEEAMYHGGFGFESIVDVSTWQDDVKDSNKVSIMGNWHFADQPIIREPFTGKLPKPTYNVTSYLNSAWKSLSNPQTTDPWVWAFHLRSMIHFIGDIHTPHHNCALFSDIFRYGDYGGNSYKLNCPYGSACNNIHFFWDSVGLEFPIMYPRVPLLIDQFNENVSNIKTLYPTSHYPDISTYSPNEWSKESFLYASKYGYDTPMDSFPNQTFFELVRSKGKERVALAGYRLFTFLKMLANQENIPASNARSSKTVLLWIVNMILLLISIVFMVIRPQYNNYTQF